MVAFGPQPAQLIIEGVARPHEWAVHLASRVSRKHLRICEKTRHIADVANVGILRQRMLVIEMKSVIQRVPKRSDRHDHDQRQWAEVGPQVGRAHSCWILLARARKCGLPAYFALPLIRLW